MQSALLTAAHADARRVVSRKGGAYVVALACAMRQRWDEHRGRVARVDGGLPRAYAAPSAPPARSVSSPPPRGTVPAARRWSAPAALWEQMGSRQRRRLVDTARRAAAKGWLFAVVTREGCAPAKSLDRAVALAAQHAGPGAQGAIVSLTPAAAHRAGTVRASSVFVREDVTRTDRTPADRRNGRRGFGRTFRGPAPEAPRTRSAGWELDRVWELRAAR